jgi:CcmD family protein
MAFLFGAYFVLWAVTFGYVFYLNARQKRVQQELERLAKKVDQ